MEAIFLVCGAGGPQLKRNPLGSNPKEASVGRFFASLKRFVYGPPNLPNVSRGSLADIRSYVDRLLRSPADGGTLVIRVVGAEPFVQFTGGPHGVDMDFPLITATQRDREDRIRRFFEARSIHIRSTFGSNGAQFIDVDLSPDPARVASLAEAVFLEIFELPRTIELEFAGEGWGVAA